MTEAKSAVKKFIAGRFGLGELGELRDDDPLIELGVLDSMKIFELIAFLESNFRVKLEIEKLTVDSFSSIENIAKLVSGSS